MNKETAKDYLPLVQALAEGKVIQVMGDEGNWKDVENIFLNNPASSYRIKPEPVEIWVNHYPGEPWRDNGPYETKGQAERMSAYWAVQKRYREVIE